MNKQNGRCQLQKKQLHETAGTKQKTASPFLVSVCKSFSLVGFLIMSQYFPFLTTLSSIFLVFSVLFLPQNCAVTLTHPTPSSHGPHILPWRSKVEGQGKAHSRGSTRQPPRMCWGRSGLPEEASGKKLVVFGDLGESCGIFERKSVRVQSKKTLARVSLLEKHSRRGQKETE